MQNVHLVIGDPLHFGWDQSMNGLRTFLVSWDLGTLPAGGKDSVTLTVRVNSPLANGKIIHNPSSITSIETPSVTANADVTVLSSPTLSLTKTASKSLVTPDDTLVYNIQYGNAGTGQATGVILEDHLSNDVTFVSATGGGTESGGTITWPLGTILPGMAGSASVTVRVNSPLADGRIIHNPAGIRGNETGFLTAIADVTVVRSVGFTPAT